MKLSTYLGLDLLFIALIFFLTLNIGYAADYVFEINEGEKIKLLPEVLDFDNDSIEIIYSYPLNSSGEWQTTFADAGVYLTKVTATDGINKDIKTVKIIVKNVDRAPEISVKDHYYVEENKTLSFGISTFDPDKDNVSVEVVNPPENSVFENGYFNFTPSFDFVQKNWIYKALQAMHLKVRPKKNVYVTFVAKSNNLTTNKTVKITVIDTNRPPKIGEIKPIIAQELDEITINLTATDPDSDWLFYKVRGWINSKKYKTKLGDVGKYQVTVFVTDGVYERKYVQDIIIKRKNIAPEITNLKKVNTIVLKEGEEKTIKLKVSDKNNDKTWIISNDLPEFAKIQDNKIIFNPGYDLANKTSMFIHHSTINVTDGNLQTSYGLDIIVKDTNRKPEIINYSPEIFTKQEVFKPITLEINVCDEDNDKLTYYWTLPGWIKLKTSTGKLAFKPTSIGKKKISVKVCDEDNACVKKEWIINVYKVIRK